MGSGGNIMKTTQWILVLAGTFFLTGATWTGLTREPAAAPVETLVRRQLRSVPCPGGLSGGGALPFGPNQTAELADGELYQLKGWVRIRGSGSAYLEIDFCAHPWLASAQRRAAPYYLLGQPVYGTWINWKDRKIELAVRPHTEILASDDFRGRLLIWLESLQMPTYIRN